MDESTASTATGGRWRLVFLRGRSQESENDGPTRICHCGATASLRREGAREVKLGKEHESLFHGEHGEEKVILHDVSGNDFEQSGLQSLAVQGDEAFSAVFRDTISEGIDQGGFSRATGTEQSHDLTVLGLAGDIIK
ncbi:hypothetical protein K1719_005810 [Acacia pycnantha]|nr:hypothetical protein K1719_005810 [Acacia pycnantha]